MLRPFSLLVCLAGLSLVTGNTNNNKNNPLTPRQQCSVGYDECDADGSNGSKPPDLNKDKNDKKALRGLFTDVANSVNGATTKRDATLFKRDGDKDVLCCQGMLHIYTYIYILSM